MDERWEEVQGRRKHDASVTGTSNPSASAEHDDGGDDDGDNYMDYSRFAKGPSASVTAKTTDLRASSKYQAHVLTCASSAMADHIS